MTTKDTKSQGLQAFLGKKVILLCANYFYAGTLHALTADSVELVDAKLVYETGTWNNTTYSNAQALPGTSWYVQIAAIESFGEGR